VNELSQTPLTDQHQALVLDNLQQPGREFCLSVELVDMAVRLPASILGFFFRFAAVAKDRRSQIRTSAAMTLNQLPECIPVALLGQADQLRVEQFGNIITIDIGYHKIPPLFKIGYGFD
jgi:hypothetical protein